ncbi:zf-C3HC-domain-containing protein [Poronia punctata]|nr:zf-C3HC-domain-containing protein [Poronia punctata]
MNATKRKFNTLLQGIGARSPQTSDVIDSDGLLTTYPSSPLTTPQAKGTHSPLDAPDTPSPSTDLLNKRRRIGHFGIQTSPSNQLKKNGGTIRKVESTDSSPPPRYCPSDRDELIRRLGTFQELTEWTPKPDKVNEIEWAKRGWTCRGKERVGCTLCHKELVVKMNTQTVDWKEVPVVAGSNVEKGFAKRFAELIVDGHDEDCLWRKHGCDDSLLRLPLAVPQTALSSLRERYDDLCTRQTFLPYLFNLRLPQTLDLKTIKSQLPPTFFTQPSAPSTTNPPSSPNDVALALALTGWQGLTNPRIGPIPNTATCTTCLRRLALWMFKSKEINETTGQVIVPAPMDHLDPVREHRFFCPWRNPLAQQNPGAKKTKDTKAAWEVLAQTLKNTAYLRRQGEKSGRGRGHGHRPAASLPGTPLRHSKLLNGDDDPATPTTIILGFDQEEEEEEEEEDMATRDAKDKERWAKLRRVKSLFDSKGKKKMQRSLSRPGTAASSSSRPATAHSRRDDDSITGGDKPKPKPGGDAA